MAIWTHKKTGNLYEIVGFCKREVDLVDCVIYRRKDHAEVLWARPTSEFFDGRFVINVEDVKLTA
jgi:hypothetical protein